MLLYDRRVLHVTFGSPTITNVVSRWAPASSPVILSVNSLNIRHAELVSFFLLTVCFFFVPIIHVCLCKCICRFSFVGLSSSRIMSSRSRSHHFTGKIITHFE